MILTFPIEFPLPYQCMWQVPGTLTPAAHMLEWLLNPCSLTERLQRHCRQFDVQVLGQALLTVTAEEAEKLQLPDGQAVVREVLLCGDGQPWVFARSILPAQLAQQGQQNLLNMGKQPLGKVLFNDQRFVRAPFEVCQVPPDSPLHQQLQLNPATALYGRRSMFSIGQSRIMVAEVFLPGSPACLATDAEVSCEQI